MNLRNIVKVALFLLLLHLKPSSLQSVAEIDVPQLQLLASNLKPEECVKLVFLDSRSELSDAQIQKLAREQSCFRRLVRWICQLRTVTGNTYTIVNDFLERIGRGDLIACLAEFNMRTSQSPKVIRNVKASDESEDYEGFTTTSSSLKPKEPQQEGQATTKSSNRTLDIIIRQTTFKVSLMTIGIVLVSTILVTCCCTLFIRSRLATLWDRICWKKKKKGKLLHPGQDDTDVSKSYFMRKPRAKRKRAPSYEMVHTATQDNIAAAPPKEPEEPPPTGCYKCYKKKRKKSAKRPHR